MAAAKFSKGIILILILGLGLRLINIGQSFWLDEASQAQMSSWAVGRIWDSRQNDFHPPLFYLLAHYWLQLGKSETWLRLPSVIFGVVNIYLLYLFSRKLFQDQKIQIGKRKFGLEYLVALLLALNPFHIYYSQEFRSYSLMCLLGTWSMYLLYSNQFFWLAIANVLLLYTHYSSVFLILTQIIYVFIYQKQNLKKLVLTLFLTLAIYIPWIPQLISQLQSGINIDSYFPGWRQVLSLPALKALPLTLFKLTAGRINFISPAIYLVYFIFVLGVVFFAFRFAVSKRNFLFTWVLLPIFLMIAFSFIFPQNQPFRVIYILPGLMLIFALSATRFPKLLITLFLYICLVGNLAYFTRPRLQREQWRQALEFVRGQTVIVKFPAPFSTQSWYSPDLKTISAVPSFPARGDQVGKILLASRLHPDQDLYLFDYLGDITDPRREVDLTLENLGYRRMKTYDYPGVGFIHLFRRI